LVDFCTTIIGEINMINNVDEQPSLYRSHQREPRWWH